MCYPSDMVGSDVVRLFELGTMDSSTGSLLPTRVLLAYRENFRRFKGIGEDPVFLEQVSTPIQFS